MGSLRRDSHSWSAGISDSDLAPAFTEVACRTCAGAIAAVCDNAASCDTTFGANSCAPGGGVDSVISMGLRTSPGGAVGRGVIAPCGTLTVSDTNAEVSTVPGNSDGPGASRVFAETSDNSDSIAGEFSMLVNSERVLRLSPNDAEWDLSVLMDIAVDSEELSPFAELS